jgi:hypothetical protein
MPGTGLEVGPTGCLEVGPTGCLESLEIRPLLAGVILLVLADDLAPEQSHETWSARQRHAG